MKLTRPDGVTACRPEGELGEQDSRNNRLRPEKFLWMRFRTGVQLSPPPPQGYYTNTYYFHGGFAVTVWF